MYQMPMNKDLYKFLFFIFFLLGSIFGIITYIIDMPYNKWLLHKMPAWIAVLNVTVLGFSIIISSYRLRIPYLPYVVGGCFVLSMSLLKVSFEKAPLINGLIFLFSIFFHLIKTYSKRTPG